MADYRRDTGMGSMNRSSQFEDRGSYGSGSSYEGAGAYESYGRATARPVQIRDRSYRESYDYDRNQGWDIAGTGTLSTLAIGAGLGLLGWYLYSSRGSGEYSYGGSSYGQGSSGRSWMSRGSNQSSVESDETTELIASNKVEGTAVYDRQGNKLGEVYNFMVGKRSGRVAYAVMSFGGLMGIGSSLYPLPWNTLDYDTSKGGYVVDLDKDRLSQAPSYAATENGFSDPGYGRRVSDYWSSTGSTSNAF